MGNPFNPPEKFGYRKFSCKRTEYHDFPSNFFCLGLKKKRWGTLRYIRKVQLSKNFMRKRAISLFSPFSRFTAYKIRWGTPLCFRILGTSKTFMLSRGGGGRRDIPLVFVGLPVLKIFVSNPINLTEKVGFRNFHYMRTENHVLQSKSFVSQFAKSSWKPFLCFRIIGVSKTFMQSRFTFDFFLSQSTEKLLEAHLKFQKVSNVRYRKFFCKRTEYHDFPSNFFCLGLKKNRWGTFRYIRKIQLSKNFMRKRAISLFSPFSRFTAYKIRWGTPLCFRILGTSKTFMLSRGGGVVIFRWFLLASQY